MLHPKLLNTTLVSCAHHTISILLIENNIHGIIQYIFLDKYIFHTLTMKSLTYDTLNYSRTTNFIFFTPSIKNRFLKNLK